MELRVPAGARCRRRSRRCSSERDDHYGHEEFIQRTAASSGHREETLREAGLSLRTGLRDLGSVVRQADQHAKRLLTQHEGVMRQVHSAPANAAAVKCDLVGDVLRSFGPLRFPATGWSMLPAVWPGDTLVVERVSKDQIQVGDVVVVGRDGKLCGHRVIRAAGDSQNPQWITQGDALPIPDRPVLENELLGRVSYLIRAGKLIAVPAELSLAERLTAKIVRRSVPVARALVYLHRMVQTSEKSAPEEPVACQD